MADAYCGPSNALQDFKRHTQVDRSLQQDHLTGPRIPAQSFRTQDPRAGSLDADFHAFENAQANPFPEPFIGSNLAPQTHFQHSAASDWANDFERLRIANSPVSAQDFRSYAPLVKSANGGWHNEYLRQQQPARSSVSLGKQAVIDQLHPQQQIYNSQLQVHGGFTAMAGRGMDMYQPAEISQIPTTDQVMEADWSQAFEEAFQDAFQAAEQTQQAEFGEKTRDLNMNGVQTNGAEAETLQTEKIKIGSDAIDYVEMKDRTVDHEQQDASALARVAGELLHNVQHDNSEKFQNSQFLDLMRKIRDRQVEVKNNDFEPTATRPDEIATHDLKPVTDGELHAVPDPMQDQDTFLIPDMDPIYAPRHEDYVDYTFDSDQFPSHPRNQMSDLHPGGKLYPEQSPPGTHTHMSGAIPVSLPSLGSSTISAADFESAYDQSHGLASKYRRPTA